MVLAVQANRTAPLCALYECVTPHKCATPHSVEQGGETQLGHGSVSPPQSTHITTRI